LDGQYLLARAGSASVELLDRTLPLCGGEKPPLAKAELSAFHEVSCQCGRHQQEVRCPKIRSPALTCLLEPARPRSAPSAVPRHRPRQLTAVRCAPVAGARCTVGKLARAVQLGAAPDRAPLAGPALKRLARCRLRRLRSRHVYARGQVSAMPLVRLCHIRKDRLRWEAVARCRRS
jgi:hypothetical protein